MLHLKFRNKSFSTVMEYLFILEIKMPNGKHN